MINLISDFTHVRSKEFSILFVNQYNRSKLLFYAFQSNHQGSGDQNNNFGIHKARI